MSTAHTPGPWHVGGIKPGSQPIIYAPDGYAVANAMTFHRKHEGQGAANAALIAAAPDLLAACKATLAKMISMEISATWGEAQTLAAAIAKAEGRS